MIIVIAQWRRIKKSEKSSAQHKSIRTFVCVSELNKHSFDTGKPHRFLLSVYCSFACSWLAYSTQHIVFYLVPFIFYWLERNIRWKISPRQIPHSNDCRIFVSAPNEFQKINNEYREIFSWSDLDEDFFFYLCAKHKNKTKNRSQFNFYKALYSYRWKRNIFHFKSVQLKFHLCANV